MNSNTNPNSVSEGLIPTISAVSTNPITPQSNYSIISSEQLEEINKGLAAWKQQEINIKTQEALLAQLRFFYAARRTILFIFPIVVAIVLFVMLYVFYDENILDHWVFKGLTIFVGLTAIVEIILFPAKEKKLELQIKNLSLSLESQDKEINMIKQQIGLLEKNCSEQKDKLDQLGSTFSSRQGNIGGSKKTTVPKRKK